MKKFFAVSAAVAIVASLQANVIDWSLPTLEDDNGTVSFNANDIVFIPTTATMTYDSQAGTITDYTHVGSSSEVDKDDDYVAGRWTDNISATTSYYMAYNGGNGTYYTITDPNGSGAFVVQDVGSGDPLVPGSGSPSSALIAADETITSVHTVAAAVPEPATAVLALAGVAMLIRRRKA